MAGSLKKISKVTASGSPSVLTIQGIDSTYNVYIVHYKDIVPNSDERLGLRVTKGGTPQDDSNYDNARKGLLAHGAFQENSDVDDSKILLGTVESTATTSGAFGTLYLYNFNNSSEYSFINFESMMHASTPSAFADVGGGVHTVASASDGVSFFFESGATFTSGEMILYGLVK